MSKKYEEALLDIVTQRHGLKNHWCGHWFKCGACGKSFAAGGNWTVSYWPEGLPPEEHRCEICRAESVVGEISGLTMMHPFKEPPCTSS